MKIIAILLIAAGFTAGAATYCVGPAATGSGSGADWSNIKVWTATPARGDTWYLRDGTYGGKTLSVAASGATLITIKKATAGDHVTDTGWVSSMANQAVFGQIDFESPYWVFDGQTGGGPGAWASGFGFKVSVSSDSGALFYLGTSANNVTIRHCDMQGKGSASTSGGSISNDGFAVHGGSGLTVSYVWMHGIGRCPYFCLGQSGTLIEYAYVQSYFGSSGVHSEVASISQGSMSDFTWRYSLFTHIISTGGLMWDNSGGTSAHFYIYGNVFYKPPGDTWEQANGVIGGWTGGNGEQCKNMLVYNNTFVNVNQQCLSSFPQTFGGNSAMNNLFVSCNSPDYSIFASHDYNQYASSGANQDTHGSTAGASFVDSAGLNFTLTANTSPGTALGSPYNVDMFGNTRSTWTRGAVEFVSGGGSAPSISVQPVGGTVNAGAAFSLSVTAAGTSPLAYQWRTNNVNLPAATNATYSIGAASAADARDYTVVVTNGFGSVTSSVATLTVNAASAVLAVNTLSLAYPPQATNTTYDLSLTVTNAGPAGTTLSGTATISAPFSVVSGGSYSLGSGVSQTIVVRHTPTSKGQDSGTLALTGGGGTNITCSGVAGWVVATDRIAMTNAAFFSPFQLVVNDSIYQTVDNSSGWPGSGSAYIFFNLGSDSAVSLGALAEATNTVNNSCWVSIDTEPPQDQSQVWDVNDVTAYGSGLTYHTVGWRGNGTADNPQIATNVWNLAAGLHCLIVHGRESNFRLGTFSINTPSAPAILVQPASQQVQSGGTATFSVSANGTAPLAYQWKKNGSNITGATQGSYTTGILTTADDGEVFAVVVSNSQGNVTSQNATLSVTPAVAVGTMSATRLVTPKLTFGP